jgi:hypothetical protein
MLFITKIAGCAENAENAEFSSTHLVGAESNTRSALPCVDHFDVDLD